MSSAPQNSTANDPHAKPKVMRRPAQFSRKIVPGEAPLAVAPPAPVSTPIAPAPAPRAAALPTSRSWQDDGRFGAFAVILVAVINLVLVLALPHMAKEQAPSGPSAVTMTNNAAMPSAMAREHGSSITVYSEPRTVDDDARSMDLETLPEEHNDFSVSPNDIPAPTARALDNQ